MSFIDNGNGNGFYMPVSPAYGSNNGGCGNGFGGDGAWWLLVLILAMNGGWGNGFGAGAGGAMPYILNNSTDNDVQRGFNQQAVMTGIGDLTGAVTNGFANVQTSLCNGFSGVNATVNNGFFNAESANNARQMANMQQMFGLQSQMAQCCCDNRLATANLNSTILAENCEDRNALNMGVRDLITTGTANTQRIVDTTNEGFRGLYDKICQVESDNIKRDYENRIAALQNALDVERQANMFARFDASQNGQTATIQAGQRALANEVEQYVLPTPRPAYVVANPNCCPNNYGQACGF